MNNDKDSFNYSNDELVLEKESSRSNYKSKESMSFKPTKRSSSAVSALKVRKICKNE